MIEYTQALDSEMKWLEEQLNDYVFTPGSIDDDIDRYAVADEIAKNTRDSFIRQYIEPREKETALRVSSLGKPAVLQGLQALGCVEASEPDTKLRHIFFTGDFFESYLIGYLRLCGYDVYDMQKEVSFDDVLGHIDLCIHTPAGDAVLEVKTMSQFYFSSFVKEPNDDRGYLTQAAIYSHCLGLPIYWVCLNKGTHEVRVIKPDVSEFDKAIARARRIIPMLRTLTTLDELVTRFRCPPAVPELFRRKETGKLVVPPSMKYSPYRHAFYVLETEYTGTSRKPKEYVIDYKTREETLSILQRMQVNVDAEIDELMEEETVL